VQSTASDDDGTEPSQSRLNLDDLWLSPRHRTLSAFPGLIWGAVTLVWRAAPREFAVSALLQLAAAVGVTAELLLGRRILSALASGGRSNDIAGLLSSLVPLAIVGALIAFADIARTEQQQVLSELVARYAINRVIDVATAVDLVTYERPSFHDRLVRAHVNATIRPLQMATGVLGMLGAGFAVVGIAAALLVLQPFFLLLVVIAYIPAWFVTTRASKAGHDFSVDQTERDRRRDYLLAVLCRKEEAAEVRAFGVARFLRDRHDRLYEEKLEDLRTLVRRRLRLGLLGGLLTSALTMGTITVLVLFVSSGRISLAVAGAAAGAVLLLGQRLQALSSNAGALYESSLFIEDFTRFVESMPQIESARPRREPPARFSQLVADHVTFTYPSRERPSLRDVSIQINAGEVVALVGENGSGKTTLAKVLAGLYSPQAGAVRWDGEDVAGYDAERLRDSVAVIFQDFVKYDLPVWENIALGRHEHSDDRQRVVDAARRAGADGYIASLEKAYDTRLGAQFAGGSELSIGQWQRLALARTFFRDAPFIVLDEPAASLDPRAEFRLFEDIRALARDRTVLFISHRFSNVRLADRIYVLRDGRVVEQGTHDDLVRTRGLYAELFALQASSYSDQGA
jgi:ATP-binding cassette subfamily B protein